MAVDNAVPGSGRAITTDTDALGIALRSIEAALCGQDRATAVGLDGGAFTVYNADSGETCATGLPKEVAEAEARRMSREYDAMLLLVRAYADGEISGYAVRASRPAAV